MSRVAVPPNSLCSAHRELIGQSTNRRSTSTCVCGWRWEMPNHAPSITALASNRARRKDL